VNNREIIRLSTQPVWGKIAVLNFALGGSGAAYHVLMSLLGSVNITLSSGYPQGYKLIASALVALAFLTLALETRYPERIFHLFSNLRSSWMSREALFGVIFILCASTDFFFPHWLWTSVSVLSALGYLIAQSCIFYSAKAVPAWSSGILPLSLFFSSISGGVGWVVLTAGSSELRDAGTSLLIVSAMFFNILLWRIHVSLTERMYSSFRLKHFLPRHLKSTGAAFGLVLPLALFSLMLISSGQQGNQAWYQAGFRVLTAACLIGFSMYQKAKTVKAVSHLKTISLSLIENNRTSIPSIQ
jgi:DMSO reductase anchor subunit